MGVAKGPGPWAGVLLSDEETIQIIAVLADGLDGHDVRDAVSAAWSLLSNRWALRPALPTPAPSTWPTSTGGWLTGLAPGQPARPSEVAAELTQQDQLSLTRSPAKDCSGRSGRPCPCVPGCPHLSHPRAPSRRPASARRRSLSLVVLIPRGLR
jgi:hypothetical protein